MSSPPLYSHRQLGRATLVVGGALCLGMGAMALRPGAEGARWAFLMTLALVPIVMLVFGALRVEVSERALCWQYGWLGWPRWELPLSDIVRVQADRQSWMEGWGIRYTVRGMLYSIGGLDVVRVTRRDGKSFRLGTDDLAGLMAVLAPRVQAPNAPARQEP